MESGRPEKMALYAPGSRPGSPLPPPPAYTHATTVRGAPLVSYPTPDDSSAVIITLLWRGEDEDQHLRNTARGKS